MGQVRLKRLLMAIKPSNCELDDCSYLWIWNRILLHDFEVETWGDLCDVCVNYDDLCSLIVPRLRRYGITEDTFDDFVTAVGGITFPQDSILSL